MKILSEEQRERQNAYNRAHYQRNREAAFARAAKTKLRLAEVIRVAKDVPCMDCGVRYPTYVMDLDHRPGEVKIVEPCRLRLCGSLKKVMAELAKCDVVCSNCHRERTQQRLIAQQSPVR